MIVVDNIIQNTSNLRDFDSSFNVIKREAPPITKRRFAILLPTTFPHAKSGEPLKTAFIETTNSGADVPNATIVIAIK